MRSCIEKTSNTLLYFEICFLIFSLFQTLNSQEIKSKKGQVNKSNLKPQKAVFIGLPPASTKIILDQTTIDISNPFSHDQILSLSNINLRNIGVSSQNTSFDLIDKLENKNNVQMGNLYIYFHETDYSREKILEGKINLRNRWLRWGSAAIALGFIAYGSWERWHEAKGSEGYDKPSMNSYDSYIQDRLCYEKAMSRSRMAFIAAIFPGALSLYYTIRFRF